MECENRKTTADDVIREKKIKQIRREIEALKRELKRLESGGPVEYDMTATELKMLKMKCGEKIENCNFEVRFDG